MKNSVEPVHKNQWLLPLSALSLVAIALTACTQPDNQPDVVVVQPSASTSTLPTVVPTAPVVIVSPSPVTPPPVVVSPTTVTPPTTAVVVEGEPITDVVIIAKAPTKEALVGRRVQFTNTDVIKVIGDRPFWVGRSNTEGLAVVLDPSLDKGAAEEQIQVKAGQKLDLTGVLKPMPDAATAKKLWGISDAEAKEFQTQGVYLQADTINFR
ncbi:hypothetical protein [Merismopedia glauca]|nr:hypothetical protein [Merismopedia glauca]